MTNPPPPHAAPPSRWPLQRKLAVLISALLATLIAVFGLAAYREMRNASVERAGTRLERVADQLAALSAGSPRLDVLRRLATDTAVVAAAARGRGDSLRLAEILGRTVPAGDSISLGFEIWTAAGGRIHDGSHAMGRDSALLAGARQTAVELGAPQRSVLYRVGDRMHAWTVVPIVAGGRTVGALAELRRIIGNARSAESIRELIGDDVSVYVTSLGAGEWATIAGRPISPPFTLPRTDGSTAVVPDSAGAAVYVAHAQVAGTPWLIVLAEPAATVMERPREFLRFLALIGLLLLATGAGAAWLLGRHVTRPLRSIMRSAEALAAGDYSQRVNVTGSHELAQLGATFNTMATAIGDAHAELASRNEALQRANEAKSRFLAMMSHELRTPLNAIGGYTELLELGMRGPVTEAQLTDLRRIRRNRDHLLTIITDILNFARADAGQLSVNVGDVSLRTVFGDTVESLGNQFEANGVRLAIELPPEDVRVRADRDKLQQVLLNLLTNALRFTEHGGEVRVTAATEPNAVRIEVTDTGVGIPHDQLEAIFEPFVQVSSGLTREVGGTGLGLAIARELMAAMGGTLDVASRVGVGSTFTARLPRPNGPDLVARPVAAGATSPAR